MKQTILGANGTIGAVLARELSTYTKDIRLVSRNPKKVNETDELFPADLSDPKEVEKAIAGSAIVYLLVGFEYKFSVWQEKWPRLMRATLDACIKHKAKLVFFDNVYMYALEAIPHMTENSPIDPPSKKGAVRKEIADMLMADVKAGKLEALIARSADFYGPNNANSIMVEMVYKNLKKGKKPQWMLNANLKHSFTYTPDAAKATALLGNTADAYNQVWHLPTDPNSLTGAEIVTMFNKEMKTNKKPMVVPMWMLRILGLFIPIMKEFPEMMYQYDRAYFFDSSKFDQRFEFRTTTYKDGIKETIEKTSN